MKSYISTIVIVASFGVVNNVSAQPLHTYNWHQHQRPVQMQRTSDYLCYLTAVQGKFQGGGEWVSVYRSRGFWMLGGGSRQKWVGASAQCIPLASLGITAGQVRGPFTWNQDNIRNPNGGMVNYRRIGGRNDVICFLARVGGKFEGSAEYLETRQARSGWYLGGLTKQRTPTKRFWVIPSATKRYRHIGANAYCIQSPELRRRLSREFRWHQNDPRELWVPNARACFLTRISGKFRGGGERVWIHAHGAGTFSLGDRSRQKSIAASVLS